jgi:anti-sigma B factor antagonist
MRGTSALDTKVDYRVWDLGAATRVIDMHGELTGDAEGAVLRACAEAVGNNTRLVVLNFNQLSNMNSSGIGLLITLVVRAKYQGKRLAAVALPARLEKILLLTGLNEALPIFHSFQELEAAIAGGAFYVPPS